MVSDFSRARFGLYFVMIIIFFMASGALLAFSFVTYGVFFFALGIIALHKIWRLYHQTNRSIAFFFDAVRNNDTTLAFPEKGSNKSLNSLNRSLNLMNQHIRNLKLESEVREKYFRTIIRHSATGFIVMSKTNGVELINESAAAMAGISPTSANPGLLKVKNNKLYETLCSLKAGDNYTFRNYNKYSVQQLLIKATEIKTDSRELLLFSIQDIKPELSEKEIDAYQKLISILTHEIMNALAPLTSISRTLNKIFAKKEIIEGNLELGDAEISTTIQGLKAIEEQSESLTNFVGNYRKLVKIPSPEIAGIDIHQWIQQLFVLFNEICLENGIRFEIKNECRDNELTGDKNLLNQVLINLIRNAIEALDQWNGDKRIAVIFSNQKNSFYIQVGNSGPYIPPELQEKIFVPFFTTKQNGSGIGLSISNQIIQLHKGTLDVFSDESAGTIFTLKLQNIKY